MPKARNDQQAGSPSLPANTHGSVSSRPEAMECREHTGVSTNKPSWWHHTSSHFHRPGKPRAHSWDTGQEELRTFQNVHPSGGGAQDHEAPITPFPEMLFVSWSLTDQGCHHHLFSRTQEWP